jgi:hypothetical protein
MTERFFPVLSRVCMLAMVFVQVALLQAGEVELPEGLAKAPANTWVKIHQAKTGAREQPIFVWASKAGKFVLSAGQIARSGGVPRHYDTEEFDLAKTRWVNAYPPGMEKDRPESGPVSAEYTQQRAKHRYNGGSSFYQDGKYLRPGTGGQWHIARTFGEYGYAPDESEGGSIYAFLWGHTLRYDVAGRVWTDIKAGRPKNRVWGSMAYDPVNREIVHAGGAGGRETDGSIHGGGLSGVESAGGEAAVGTWVFDIAKNTWRQLDCGSPRLKDLFGKAKTLRWQAKELLGRTASRFAVAETEEEAKVDLVAKAAALAAAAEAFAAEIGTAGLADGERRAGEVAASRFRKAADAVKTAGAALDGAITADKIAAVRAAREAFELATDALAPEPPGRARSQVALAAAHNKIVLFGGDGLDRALSDTWVYDCKTRTWEQRFPERSPAPRAGHILGWLPQAGKIVLAGGYSAGALPQEIWTYDLAANEWTPLQSIPNTGKGSPNAPNVNSREYQAGAVADGDVLVCLDKSTVWACKVEPGQPAAGAAKAATTPLAGRYAWRTFSPAIWERAAEKAGMPDRDKARRFLDELPVNQWTTFGFPRYAPGSNNRWGTSAYDTDRHQFLLWGGGHSTSHQNDVAHFSVLGGFWTVGYHPDDPIEHVYASQPVAISFRNRPHVPVHAYRAYTYDPTEGKMFYFDRAYDPLVREWLPKPFPGLAHKGVFGTHMKATPGGAVTLSEPGLFRFDAAAAAWKKLAKGFGMWCDGPCMVYDSKRDCLWIGTGNRILKFDFATNAMTDTKIRKPKAIGKDIRDLWHGEAVYIPEADLVLAMRAAKGPDGKLRNYAWSPEDGKFYWLDFKWVENGKAVGVPDLNREFQDAMAYDPKLKLCLVNHTHARKVWAMRFDREAANLVEIINP